MYFIRKISFKNEIKRNLQKYYKYVKCINIKDKDFKESNLQKLKIISLV